MKHFLLYFGPLFLALAVGIVAQWPFPDSERVYPDFYITTTCLERFGGTQKARSLEAVIHRSIVLTLAVDTVSWECDPQGRSTQPDYGDAVPHR